MQVLLVDAPGQCDDVLEVGAKRSNCVFTGAGWQARAASASTCCHELLEMLLLYMAGAAARAACGCPWAVQLSARKSASATATAM